MSIKLKRRISACSVFIVLCLFAASSARAADRLVFAGDSAYTGLQVYDKEDGLRYLNFGIYEQTAMRIGDPDYLHYEYTRTTMAGFACAEPPVRNVLMLGLGGGAMAQFLAGKFPEANLETIEIDPLVVEVASRYFGFKPGEHGNITIGDGRRLLKKREQKYDVIILDAYKAGEIPFHLTTVEFMQTVRNHLAPAGVVAVHLWAEYVNKYLQSQIRTIAEVFPRNYSFYDGAGSYLIFATLGENWLSKETLVKRGEQIGRERRFSFDLGELIDQQYSRVPTSGLQGEVLTDDFAPVNLLREQPVSR